MKNLEINWGRVHHYYRNVMFTFTKQSDGSTMIENAYPDLVPCFNILNCEFEVGDKLWLHSCCLSKHTYRTKTDNPYYEFGYAEYDLPDGYHEIEITYVRGYVIFYKFVEHPEWEEKFFNVESFFTNDLFPKEFDINKIKGASKYKWFAPDGCNIKIIGEDN